MEPTHPPPPPPSIGDGGSNRQQLLGDLLNHDNTVNMVLQDRARRNSSRASRSLSETRLDQHPSIAEFENWRQYTVQELKSLRENHLLLEDKVAHLEVELEKRTANVDKEISASRETPPTRAPLAVKNPPLMLNKVRPAPLSASPRHSPRHSPRISPRQGPGHGAAPLAEIGRTPTVEFTTASRSSAVPSAVMGTRFGHVAQLPLSPTATAPSAIPSHLQLAGEISFDPAMMSVTTDDKATRIWQAKESMWDAALFLGDNRLSLSDNLVTFFLLCCTFFIQLAFIFVLLSEYNHPYRGELAEIKEAAADMRNSIGNHVRYRDALTGAPLVEQLCADIHDHVIVGVASDMRHLVVELDRYLKLGGVTVLPGPILAICALTCYYAALVTELRDLMLMPSAVNALVQERERVSAGRTHRRRSKYRIPIAYAMATIRFIILICLMYTGTIFIVNTLIMRDLVLNAVALVFVIEVDEILFMGALHFNVKCLVKHLRPVPIKNHKFSQYFDAPFGVSVLGCIGVWLVVAGSIYPMVRDAMDVVEEICGGRRDFLYTTNGEGVVVWTEVASQRASYLQSAVEELRESTEGSTTSVRGKHVETTRQVQLADVDTLVFNWRSCFEDVNLNETRQRFVLEGELGFPVNNCDVLHQHCDRKDELGLHVRQACPHTCGCDAPITTFLFHRDPEAGCGYGCYGSQEWHGWRMSTNCTDTPPDAPEWQGHLGALKKKAVQEARYQEMHDGLKSDGCKYVQQEGLCQTVNQAALMLLMCPETCNCPQRDPEGCPTACAR